MNAKGYGELNKLQLCFLTLIEEVTMTIQVFGAQATVSYLNRAFTDTSPANAIFNNQVARVEKIGEAAFANEFAAGWSGLTNAALSKQVLTNMGILPTKDTSVAALEQALTDYFTAFGAKTAGTNGQTTADTRGFIVLQLASILSNSETSTGNLAVYNAAAVAWNSEVAASYSYSANTANTTPTQTGTTGQSLNLTVNQDAIVGGTGDDTINGVANQNGIGLINTIQSVDTIDGGAGNDTLSITLAQILDVAPSVVNVENIAVRFAGAGNLNLAGVTGLSAVTAANSTVAGTLSEIGALASLSIKNQNVGVTVSSTAGSATTMALGFDTVGTKTSTTVTPIVLDLGATNGSKVTTANITMKDAYVKLDSAVALGLANGTTASNAMGVAITAAAPGTAAATAIAAIAANAAVTTAANAAAAAAGATVASVTTAAQTAASAAAQAAVKYDAITTATIAATGSNTLTLTDSQTTLNKITVTGDGSLNLMEGGVVLSALTTFDASAAKGDVKAEVINLTAKPITITTGAGNDYIKAPNVSTGGSSANMGAGNDTLILGLNLDKFDKSNGGEGTDIINIADAADLTATSAKTITGFETLDISGSAVGTYDLSLNSFTTIQVDETIAGILQGTPTLTKAPDNFGLTLISKAKTGADFTVGQPININGANYAGTTAGGDAETFTLIASLNDGNKDGTTANGNILNNSLITVAIAGAQTNDANGFVENVVIQAIATTVDGGTTDATNKTSAYTLKPNLVTYGTETITIKGDASVDFTGSTFNASTAATAYNVSKVDASASTGNITLDLSGMTTNAVSYTGSAGVDTYKASGKGDMIYTGKGGDVISLTAAAIRDTLVFKAGTDSQLTDVSKDGKATLAGDMGAGTTVDTVLGGGGTFKTALSASAGGDRIDLTNFGFASAQRGVEDISSKVTTSTDLTSVTGLFNSVAGSRGAAFAYAGGDAYVFVDANKDGNFTAADDLVIKLTGIITGLAEADFNF
jgi:hypothetical protein